MSYVWSRRVIIVAYAICVGAFSACSRETIPGVYRIDIQQGNVITQEMLDQLEPGMERRKVRYILGTPMLTDTFNESRWDYYYSYTEGGSNPVKRRISVFFDGDKLARIEGDIRPALGRRPVNPRKETIVTVPQDTGEEGFLSGLKPGFLGGKKKSPPAAEPAAAAPDTAPAPDVEGEPPAKPVAEESSAATSASASASQVPEPTSRDEQYLQRLFQGFGKADTRPGGQSAGGGSGDGKVAGDEAGANESGDTAASDDGFFKRLLKRLRPAAESDSATAESPSSSPPEDTSSSATPEPAAP